MKSPLPVLLTDAYKISHRSMEPANTEMIYSNWTPRGSRMEGVNEAVVFGVQYFLKEYLIKQFNENFFNKPLGPIVDKYKKRLRCSLGQDDPHVQHIADLHGLGFLPLQVNALDEGALCPMRVPLLTFWNTHKDFSWLTNYLETLMSNVLWMPITSATSAFQFLRKYHEYAEKTGASLDAIPFQGHDFSMRGMSSVEAACASGGGHLLSFVGTDTIPAIDFLEEYYYANEEEEMVGVSVPASEHSIQCLHALMKGDEPNDRDYVRAMLDAHPTGIFSMVSDGFDFWKLVTQILPEFKEEIMLRDRKVVIRPDSGNPVDIICGDPVRIVDDFDGDFDTWKTWVAEEMDDQFQENLEAENPHSSEEELYQFGDEFYFVTYEPDLNRYDKQYYYVDNYGSTVSKCKFEKVELSPEQKGAIQCLWDIFAGTVNEKGFKTLDSHIGLIYGDAITPERQDQILKRLAEKGFASDNIVLGMGSFLYSYKTRDSLGQAVKAVAGIVDGKTYEIYKDPKTDDGTKKSARGFLRVNRNEHGLSLEDRVSWDRQGGELKPVFRDGELLNPQTLSQIRQLLHSQI